MMTTPLRMVWVDGESHLLHPAGTDCGLSIHVVMMVAATPPMMIATICWSLKRFFIGWMPPLTGVHGAPHDGNALSAGKLHQHPGRRQTEDGAGGIALDDKGAGARAIRRRVGHCDPLHALGNREAGRDVAAGPHATTAANGRGSLGH